MGWNLLIKFSLRGWLSARGRDATMMTWASTAVSIGSSLIVLPLAILHLTEAELALWLSYSLLLTFGMMADFGFAPSAVRAAAAYMAGAACLPDYGRSVNLTKVTTDSLPVNAEGLTQLEGTLIWVYRRLLILAIILTVLGVIWIYPSRGGALNDYRTAEWSVFLLLAGMVFTLYAQMWGALRQMLGNIAALRRMEVVLGLIRIVCTVVVLFGGGGLLGVLVVAVCMSAATVVVSRNCYISERSSYGIDTHLGAVFHSEIFSKVWPATWRQGIIIIGGFIINQSGGLIIARLPDASEAARYLLTLRIFGVLRQFAQAPIYAHIPYFSRLLVESRITEIKKEFARRISLALWILVGGLCGFFIFFDLVLPYLGHRYFLVNPRIYTVMAFSLVLEAHHGAHSNLYLARNHVPFIIPSIVSGGLIVACSFMAVGPYGVLGVVLAQMIVQLAWNNWYPVMLNLNLLDWSFPGYLRSLSRSLINILTLKGGVL